MFGVGEESRREAIEGIRVGRRGGRLTLQHCDGDGLLLLDGLRIWEAGIADVVVPAVLWEHVGKVQVAVQGLGHAIVQRQLLEN